jgi:hypothetical protein
MIRVHGFVLASALVVLGAIACGQPDRATTEDWLAHGWHQVFKDADYQVSLDTAHIERGPDDSYLVWYETVHATLRGHNGRPWNREIIRSYLRCDPLSFKTVRITIFLNDGPAVAQEGGDPQDVADQSWKDATAPVDKVAMTRACEIIIEQEENG